MADIRIQDLPLATGLNAPAPSDVIPIDGSTTRKTALGSIADVVNPPASQAEAEAGTDSVKRMTALTTKQSIASQVGMAAGTIAAGNDPRIVNAVQANTSPTLTGANLSITGAAQTLLTVNGDAGSARRVQLSTGGVGRWFIQANTVAETGSNAGSNLEIVRRADDGSNLGSAVSIARSTGVATLSAAPVVPGLPNLSASVQGTGTPGLDGGKWFIWNNQVGATFDSVPNLRIDRNMSPTVVGGVSGNTYQALKISGTAGANNQGYEWPVTVELFNRARGSLNSQNVAIASAAWVDPNGVEETGRTWASNFNVSDRTGTVNPTYGRIGLELDCYATAAASTDNNRSRCILQLAFGTVTGDTPTSGTPLHIGRGILIGSHQANTILDRAFEFSGNGVFDIGIDTTAADFITAPYFMKEGQRIAFDGNTSGVYSRSLRYQTGKLVYETSAGEAFGVSDTGDLSGAGLSLSVTGGSQTLITINGDGGSARRIQMSSGGSARWFVQTNAVAESGGNAGSNFEIVRRSDAGANLGTPLSIARSSGIVTLASPLTIGSSQVVGNRDTGWVSWTGASNKNTVLDTSTATVGQVAQRLAAIQIALTAHGLIGA